MPIIPLQKTLSKAFYIKSTLQANKSRILLKSEEYILEFRSILIKAYCCTIWVGKFISYFDLNSTNDKPIFFGYIEFYSEVFYMQLLVPIGILGFIYCFAISILYLSSVTDQTSLSLRDRKQIYFHEKFACMCFPQVYVYSCTY